MHSCEQVQRILEGYLAGELLPSDQQILDQHLPSCVDCQSLVSIHEELIRMDTNVADPSPEALRAMRSRVLGQISQGNNADGKVRFRRTGSPLIPALAAAAMLVLGVFLAYGLIIKIIDVGGLNDGISHASQVSHALVIRDYNHHVWFFLSWDFCFEK